MEPKGFLQSLFDYSFSSFITARLIKVLYVLSTILIALDTLALVLFLFKTSAVAGLFGLVILGPLVFIIGMIYARVILELLIVIFRIHEDVRDINVRGGGGASADVPLPLLPADPEPTLVAAAEPESSTEADATRFCKNCGAEIVGENRFCTSCGTPVD